MKKKRQRPAAPGPAPGTEGARLPQAGRGLEQCPALEVCFQLEARLLPGWFALADRKNGIFLRRAMYMLFFGVLAVNFLFAIPWAQVNLGPGTLGPAALGLLCLCGLLFVYFSAKAQHNRAARAFQDGFIYRVRFEEKGFTVQFPEGPQTFAYSGRVRAAEFADFYLLEYAGRRFLPIPKGALGRGEIERLSAILQGALAGDFKDCTHNAGAA